MIRLVGMGPGSPEYLTAAAIDRITSADVVVAFGRIAATAALFRADVRVISRVEELQGHLEEGMDTAVLASGDPCFYGILDFLVRQGIQVDEVVPGLSSMQYLMAKLGKSWQDAALISFHGREAELGDIKRCRLAVIFTDSRHTPGYISKRLYSGGLRGKIYAGFNLSYADELIVEKEIGEEIEDISKLALVVIENEMDKG